MSPPPFLPCYAFRWFNATGCSPSKLTPCLMYAKKKNPRKSESPTTHLQLHIIVHQPHLLAGLERRQANVWTSVTPERISQRTVATRADLSLHCEIHLGQILGLQFREVVVGCRALGRVFGVQPLGQATGAVFARAAALGVGFACFGCKIQVSFVLS